MRNNTGVVSGGCLQFDNDGVTTIADSVFYSCRAARGAGMIGLNTRPPIGNGNVTFVDATAVSFAGGAAFVYTNVSQSSFGNGTKAFTGMNFINCTAGSVCASMIL